METWRLGIVTWNVGKQTPGSNAKEKFSHFLSQTSLCTDANVVVVSLQEVSAPSQYFNRFWTATDPWTTIVQESITSLDYVLVSCSWNDKPRQFGTVLLIFMKRDLLKCIADIRTQAVKTALAGYAGVKGSVGLQIRFQDKTCLTFVNSHFTPHQENLTDRIRDYRTTIETLKFSGGSQATIADDYVFWMGDFNCRVDFYSNQEAGKLCMDPEAFKKLLPHDQMIRCRKEGEAFHHFQEGDITFPPTYKFVFHSANYDLQRMPSWCDRILWRVDEIPGLPKSQRTGKLAAKLLSYSSYPPLNLSDHIPVLATFDIQIPRSVSSHSSWRVRFHLDSLWMVAQENLCRFTVDTSYSPATMDWISVMDTNFTNDAEGMRTWMYFLSSWCTEEGKDGKTYDLLFKRQHLPPPGQYVLGYYSKYLNCLVGLSDPFQVLSNSEDIDSGIDPLDE